MNQESTSIDSLRQQAAPMAAASAESDRAIAEVQAAMTIAKKFPRDEDRAWAKIQRACKRPGLAEAALYAYTKGGSEVSGPSIRLAEELARDWGNITFGWKILSQDEGLSEVRAEAWDLETNVPSYITFTVPHHYKSHGKIKPVTDPRELYELIANQASRRLRACILRVIPGDVQDMAIDECEKTLKHGGGKPLADRIRDMLAAFQNDHNVTKTMVEQRVGKKAEAINETELVALRRIYVSLRDGMGKVDEFFKEAPAGAMTGGAAEAGAQVAAGATSIDDMKKSTAPQQPTAEKPAAASAAEPAADKKEEQQPDRIPATTTFRVANLSGRIITELGYVPKLGEILQLDGFPWRVIEVRNDHAIAKAGGAEEKRPEEKRGTQPEKGEATPIELQTVLTEIMQAETVEDCKGADELIARLPEKDRATAGALLETKKKTIASGRPARKRGGLE